MSLFGRLMNVVRRREARDAFSDDEGFEEFSDEDEDAEDGEPRSAARKIAVMLSGALFVLLSGAGVAIYIMGKDVKPPPMAMSSLEGLKLEEGPAEAPPAPPPAPAAPAIPSAKPGAKPGTAAEVAASDRSAQRRPWLNGNPPAAAAPPAAVTSPPPAPVAAPPAAKPAMTPPVQVAKVAPPPATPAPAAAPPAKPEPLKPEPQKADMPKAEAVAEAPKPPTEMPSVLGEAVPGAPDRFTASGETSAGGRPRLVEPQLPSTDRKVLAAAPPRFASIGDLKAKVVAYSKTPTDKTVRSGKVAVIVRGLGLSQSATETAITKMPPAVALSFSPYAQNLKKWLEMAKANGHEVLVEVPMESKSFPAEDPGPLGLMTSLEPKKNLERVDSILKVVPSAIGIDDSMGSKFRESEAAMSPVFAKLKEKNLIYVQTQPGVLIGEPGVPHAIADVIMDERPFRAAVDARLDYAERLAKFQGSALAVMSPKPVSYERLALWLETIKSKNIVLAPVSEVLVR